MKGIYGGPDELVPSLAGTGEWACLSFKLFFDITVGFMRVYLPRALVDRDMVTPPPAEGPALSRVMQRTQRMAERVAALEVAIHVEVGRIPFAAGDLGQLEVGDIVLIEDPQVRMVDGALDGPCNSRVGRGHHGLIQGTLSAGESGKYEVVIEEILAAAEPAPAEDDVSEGDDQEEHAVEHADGGPRALEVSRAARRALFSRALEGATVTGHSAPIPAREHGIECDEGEYDEGAYEDDDGEFEEDPLPESAGMLGDVNVPMIIELGRVAVTAADVVQLRPGQVIELARSPGEPVDLVVDGRRIGRGELVEIEGELGVRIIELVK